MEVGFIEEFEKKARKIKINSGDVDTCKARGGMIANNAYKNGYMGLMCGNCFKGFVTKISFNSNISISKVPYFYFNTEEGEEPLLFTEINYSIQCPYCKKNKFTMIEIDPNILEIIQKLNNKGYYTKFCCEGHSKKEAMSATPYVMFMCKLPEYILNTLPISWYIDKQLTSSTTIRSDIDQKYLALAELLDWADSLPSLSR